MLENHAQAVAESMAFTLFHTAHSTFVKETVDFTTGFGSPSGITFASPDDLGATRFVGLNYKGRCCRILPLQNPHRASMWLSGRHE
ncbi:hypothetical protein [Citreicella sp. C3M06]|uniref:hypothetical protein n=1 Tax=Citreicella sp. C3M06 TaxID=2841564 RepID=UPI00352D2FE7